MTQKFLTVFHLTFYLMNNRQAMSMEDGVICSAEYSEWLDYFHSEKMTLLSVRQTPLIDRPPAGSYSNQSLPEIMLK